MPASAMTYVLNHITQNLPPEILDLAFKPKQFNTTAEQRIMSQIIEGTVLYDANLVGGKRREIFLQPAWKLPMDDTDGWETLGLGAQPAFYRVPPEAREGRNIGSVIGISSSLSNTALGGGYTTNGSGGFGNTTNSMLSAMLNTRTLANQAVPPQATLEGTNVICITPEGLIENAAVTVLLEYDSEFINLENSGVFALRNLCLCAVQRYIGTRMMVPVDETQVVAGMEIGAIKQIVDECRQAGQEYDNLLKKFRGAALYDKRAARHIIRHAL